MSGQISSAAAARADMPASRGLADRDFLVVFAFIALAVAELVLVLVLPDINYGSGDGKAAQGHAGVCPAIPHHQFSIHLQAWARE